MDKLYETRRFYITRELVNGQTYYVVNCKWVNGYMVVYASLETAKRETNYFEKFKNIDVY